MGKKITRLIHNIDPFLAIGNPHVYMQTKDEIGTGDLLHVFDNCRVALIHRDELIHPVRERMGASGGDFQSMSRGQFRQLAAKIDNLLSGNACIAANSVPSSTTDWCISGLICS